MFKIYYALSLSVSLLVAPSAQSRGTIVAVPVLSNNSTGRCSTRNDSSEVISGIVAASQSYKDLVPTLLLFHSPGEEKRCKGRYVGMFLPNIEHFVGSVDFTTCAIETRCVSFMCEKGVYGINFKIYDPTFSAIRFLLTASFQQCFAMYPLPITIPPAEPELYVYNIVHGTQRRDRLGGFAIQNPYDTDSSLSINLTSPAVGWDVSDKGMVVPVGDTLDMKCREVIWVEPSIGDAMEEGSLVSLRGTVVKSSTPLNVFTNSAVLNDTDGLWEFEYDSQLVHQMPERRHWGRHFIVNPNFSEVLPVGVRLCLVHELTIFSYTAENRIFLRNSSSPHPVELNTPPEVLSEEHYEYKLQYDQAQMIKEAYLEITSIFPVVVLSDAYTSMELAICRNYSLHYSILVQPVEWYANRQTVVLIHPKSGVTYHYYVSIMAPSTEGSVPGDDIIESEPGQYCQGLPVSGYDMLVHPAGEDHTLYTYTRSLVVNATQRTHTKLLLRHSNHSARIGVTVYAFSEDLHYSYSNGYALGMQK